jgi:hypothetical protein
MHRLLLLMFLGLGRIASAQVILTEVMFNPRGNENAYEFLEIYNASATDSISVAGWKIGDQTETDLLVSPDGLLKLAPGQFAVVLDPGYFETTALYDSLIPAQALILTIDDNSFGSGGLSNSTAETVILLDAAGNTVARYTYSLDNPDGISDEKIFLSADDSPGNWANSRRIDGTPAALNSVSPRDFDLAAIRLQFDPPQPRAGDDVHLIATVRNAGRHLIESFAVTFAFDRNQDNEIQTGEEIGVISVTQPIAPEDSILVRQLWRQPPSGRHHILAAVAAALDAVSSNNRIAARLPVGYGSRSVVINEIYYAPRTSEVEWVEFFNRSNQPVDLSAWRWRDAGADFPVALPDSNLILPPGEFALLAAGRNIAHADPGARVIVLKSWLTLNNDRETLVLADFHGRVQDSLSFSQQWGGDNGISLERINPSLASADSSNWSSCVEALGSTPGKRNSIFTELVPQQAAITVSPQPFSPDGDGHDDFAIIQVQVPAATATVHVKIYDLRGRLVHQLLNNAPVGASSEVIWNGRDENNQAAPMGIYIIYLQAIQATGGVLVEARTTLVLARKL